MAVNLKIVSQVVASGTPGPAGKSAYQTAVDNGFVGTESEWLKSLLPFKGWYDSVSELEAVHANPLVGEYAYVKGATSSDPVKIYECSTDGSWSDSGRTVDTSTVQTFGSGEAVNDVDITGDSSDIEENSDKIPTAGAVAGALGNVEFSTGEKVKNVGIDDEPAAGSDNLVKSGGVHKGIENYADKVSYLPTEYTEITTDDLVLEQGYSIYKKSTPYIGGYITEQGRSVYTLNLTSKPTTVRKIKVTSGNYVANVAFRIREFDNAEILLSDTEVHAIPANTTQEFEVPINTFAIVINNYTTANIFPVYIGIEQSILTGSRDLKGYIDTKSFIENYSKNSVFTNLDTILKGKLIPKTFLHYEISMNNVESGLDHIAYIGIYDSSNQQIGRFGKFTWTGTEKVITGYIQVPDNAEYLRIITDVVDGITLNLSSNVDEIPDNILKGEYLLNEINPYIFSQFTYIIGTELYGTGTNHKMTFIPVIPGEIYCIESLSGLNLLAFVTNRRIGAGWAIPFSSEFNSRVSLLEGEKRFYKIPEDCHYIATMTAYAGGTPQSATISLVKTEIENSELPDYIIPTKQLSVSYTGNKYLDSNSDWTEASSRGFVLYQIPDNTSKIKIKGLAVIAFFTSNVIDYTQAPPLSEKSLRLQTPNDTTDRYIDVPKDAKYLYVYKPDSTAFYDVSFVTKTSLPEIINNKIESDNRIQDFGTFEEIDYTQGSYIQNMFIGSGSNPDTWNSVSGRRVTIFQIPNESKYIRITPIIANATLFLLRTDTTPVNSQKADLSEGYKIRVIATLGNSYILPLLNDCKYIAVMSLDANGNDITPKIEFASKATKVEDKIIENSCECIVGNEIWDVEFNNAPDILFANYGEHKLTNLKWITWPNVLKVSDNMYYMYYNSLYDNDTQSGDQYFHLSLAYSTDGLNWVHEIPSGITAPIPGTNKLFENGCFGQDVVKVPDSEYPYRMVGFNWHTSTAVYKSADGVNWIKLREYPYYYDTQASVIVRGKYMKVYLRMRDGAGRLDRYIGILTMDLDGNELTPPTIFFGKYFYQASASELDWRREILFPTFFNQPANTEKPECFIVDENRIYPKNVDFSNIVFPVDLSIYFAPHIINIGSDFYVYYTVANQTHDNPSVTPRETTIKRAKITFKTVGYHWYPQ